MRMFFYLTLFLSLLPLRSLAGDSVIWGPNLASTIPPELCLQYAMGGPCFIYGSDDPSVTPTFGSPGSLYLNTSGNTYVKQDSGTSTNWQKFVTGTPTGIQSLNGVTAAAQTLAVGSAGTDFAESTSGTVHTFNLPAVDATHTGKLLNTDWVIFNAKQPAGSYITALTGDVSASGPGSSSATVNSVGGSSAANIHSAELAANAATQANTPSTIVKRDGSGNFSAGTITASLTGTASGNTTYTANNHGVVISGSTNAMTVIAPDASTAKVLVSGGASADPTWALITNTNLSGSAAISNANLATMANNTVKANKTGGASTPSDLSLSDVSEAVSSVLTITNGTKSVVSASPLTIQVTKSDLTHDGYLAAADFTTFNNKLNSSLTSSHLFVGSSGNIATDTAITGDVTINNTGVTAVGSNKVANSQLAQMPTLTIKGNNTGGTANALDLTVSQVNTMLGDVTTLAAFDSSPNSNGANISGNTLTLQPADGSNPGGVSTTTQTFSGSKTFGSASGDATTIGAASSTAIHQFNGGTNRTTRTITSNLTIDTTTTDYYILCNNSGAINVTLPTPTNGRELIIKDIAGTANTNNITLVRHGSEKIEGIAASRVLQVNFGSWVIVSDGTNWWIL